MASLTEHTLEHDGLERRYRLYVPDSHDPDQACPLLIVLHGSGIDSAFMVKLTGGGFNRLPDRHSFIAVYPDALNQQWNDGRNDLPTDDVGFIRTLIDHLAAEYALDRIYATGISNGGFMAYRLAFELADRITGIAPVAAVMPEALALSSKPDRPVAVLIIAGTNDPVSPYNGGKARAIFRLLVLRSRGSRYLSAAATARFWAEVNHCDGDPVTTALPVVDSTDRTRVRQTVYSGGAAPVMLYTVEGGGHTWPGGEPLLPAFLFGQTSCQFDACAVIWDFFASLKP